MNRLILIFTLCIFYLAACTNSGAHSHDGETHTHDGTEHSHDAEAGHDHDHEQADDHDHSHPHEQEEFTVASDTLKQDSLNNHQ